MSERVYIIEYEMIGPLGSTKDDLLDSIRCNRSAAQEVETFKERNLSQTVAAPVTDVLTDRLDKLPSEIRRAVEMDRKMELGVAAASGLADQISWVGRIAPERCGLSLGLGQDVPSFEKVVEELVLPSDGRFSLYEESLAELNRRQTIVKTVGNPLDWISVYLAEAFQLGAFQYTLLTACSASNQAVAAGADAIRHGQADLVLCGGMDSVLNVLGYITLLKLGVTAPDTCRPSEICRPFDVTRRGTLVGEGAGFVVLASKEVCDRLGIAPVFELLGWANSLDGYNITAPRPDGQGIRTVVLNSLSMAGKTPDQVDFINMHGTGTVANDPIELKVVADVYGGRRSPVAASSTKDRHGHLIAAAGVQELCVLLTSLRHNVLPCNRNLIQPIPSSGVYLPQRENEERELRVGVTHSFAFGGVNSALVVEKIADA